MRNVLALPHLAVDLQRLKEEEIPLRETNTVVTMCKVLGEELRARRLHWEDFSHDEWQKSTLGLTTPKQWVQQFGELGFSNIGRQLLKGLRVITERELRDAFSVSRDQIVGLRVGYAYIKDDEAGSSSLSIKNILEHYYPSKDVFAVDLNSIDRLTEMDKDVVFVFEDGLWSGVELVRRLKTIHASEPFRQGSLQLHFRYGATSDSGLIAARLFARRERSSRVQFSAASTGYHFRFLRPSVESEVTRILTEDDDFIRKLLDTAVEPYAFREDVGWGQERDEAISICSEIGRQLVLPFLRRKKTRPNTTEQSEAQVAYADIADDDIRKWELGASRFASTVVFATSIPKPVLPLMWLSGKVTLKERTVNWKPLFWDVRRTGTVAN
ncbi:hypothetical protein [Burkholderia sp. Ac-20349]|uniref:phosphoribosyltransferase-like protein n=1 Tax=Burkholderia sp. Ac-20349 TaxID=2703893 RepID=UPI00197B8A1F|nr:hypothetical protein [Burkholderia sp. Ac-20349]MBN3844607.1 hypothetical protein [Burkholderia sp. Ac-20349]